MKLEQIESFDWGKGEGLLPAVVQDAVNGRVLMLGYMNREALRKTLGEKRVTFYSRSKQRLWTKGENVRGTTCTWSMPPSIATTTHC